jgi:hypothetical protein
MPRALVLLSAYTSDQPTNLGGPAAWWNNYFFNLVDSQRAYWLKQSDGEVNLRGITRDWVYFPNGTHNLKSRVQCASQLIEWSMNQGVDFRPFNVVIVVLGLHASIESDGGASAVTVRGQHFPIVVGRVGDPFDFWAHEIGHSIGLGHSFGGSTFYQYEGDVPGGYGHPNCVMSARAYGNQFLAIYDQIAPSLNAVQARMRGWLDTVTWRPAEGQRDHLIRSRHHLGRGPGLAMQGIHVEMPDGSDYVVEYREPAGWDRGQAGSRLIVTRDKGGLAEKTYGRAGVGSHAWHGDMPSQLGFDHAHNFDGFNLQVLNRFPDSHSVLVRLRPGHVDIPLIADRSEVKTTASHVAATGSKTFAPGEVRCVTGTWNYSRVERTQQAVMEASYGNGATPVGVTWTLGGQLLAALEGNTTLPNVHMFYADESTRNRYHTVTDIDVHYRIESMPGGSRLVVTVGPPAHIFTLRATAQLDSPIGTGTQDFACAIQCVDYDYGEEFRARRMACLANMADVGARYATYEVFPVDTGGWGRLPLERQLQLAQDLDVLAHVRSTEGRAAYERAAAAWADSLDGIAPLLVVREAMPFREASPDVSCRMLPQQHRVAVVRRHAHPEAIPALQIEAMPADRQALPALAQDVAPSGDDG